MATRKTRVVCLNCSGKLHTRRQELNNCHLHLAWSWFTYTVLHCIFSRIKMLNLLQVYVGVHARVHPLLYSKSHPLHLDDDAKDAVYNQIANLITVFPGFGNLQGELYFIHIKISILYLNIIIIII